MAGRTPSNRYYVGSKIPEAVFETLLLYFLYGLPLATVSDRLQASHGEAGRISPKSMRNIFDLLRRKLFDNDEIMKLIELCFLASFRDKPFQDAREIFSFLVNTKKNDREEIFSKAEYCLFSCGYGPNLSDISRDFGDMLTDEQSESENFNFGRIERVRRYVARIDNRKNCKDCKIPWLKNGSAGIWKSFVLYFKDYRPVTVDEIRYLVYSAAISYLIGFQVSWLTHLRNVSISRAKMVSDVHGDDDFPDPTPEEHFQFSMEAFTPLFEVHQGIKEYLTSNPIRNSRRSQQ